MSAPEASIYEAAEKMSHLAIGPLPVRDGERLVGMLTDRDITVRAVLKLQHADLLAQRMQQLGGVPLYSPLEIAAQAASVGVRPEQGPTAAGDDH